MMNKKPRLWILEPINPSDGPWEPWYDKAFGFVVRACSEQEARSFAAEESGDEGGRPWLSSEFTTCEVLTHKGDTGVILQDYHSA